MVTFLSRRNDDKLAYIIMPFRGKYRVYALLETVYVDDGVLSPQDIKSLRNSTDMMTFFTKWAELEERIQ